MQEVSGESIPSSSVNKNLLEPSDQELFGVALPEWCRNPDRSYSFIDKSTFEGKIPDKFPTVDWPFATLKHGDASSVYYRQISSDEIALARAAKKNFSKGIVKAIAEDLVVLPPLNRLQRLRDVSPFAVGSVALFGGSGWALLANALPAGTPQIGVVTSVALGLAGVARFRKSSSPRVTSAKVVEESYNDKKTKISEILSNYIQKLETPFATINDHNVYIDVAQLTKRKGDKPLEPYKQFISSWDRELVLHRGPLSIRLWWALTGIIDKYTDFVPDPSSAEYRKYRVEGKYAVEINPAELVGNIFTADTTILAKVWEGDAGLGRMLKALETAQGRLQEVNAIGSQLKQLNIAGSKSQVPLDLEAAREHAQEKLQAEEAVVLAVLGVLSIKQRIEKLTAEKTSGKPEQTWPALQK